MRKVAIITSTGPYKNMDYELITPALSKRYTVESHKFVVLWTRDLFRSIESSSNREVDRSINIPPSENDYYQYFHYQTNGLYVKKKILRTTFITVFYRW